MYKHILIPVDGSKLSDKAIKDGIALARSIKARVTGFTAVPEYRPPSEVEAMNRIAISLEDHEKRSKRKAQAMLRKVASRARAAGIKCELDYSLSNRPSEAIVKAAKKHDCDLIFMASRGRGRLGSLVLGSETQDVLSHSNIPTLVCR